MTDVKAQAEKLKAELGEMFAREFSKKSTEELHVFLQNSFFLSTLDGMEQERREFCDGIFPGNTFTLLEQKDIVQFVASYAAKEIEKRGVGSHVLREELQKRIIDLTLEAAAESKKR